MQKLVLGTVQLGVNYGINNVSGKPSDEEAFEILNTAFNNGIKVLDTADVYGNAQDVIGNYQKKTGRKFSINSKFKGNSISLEEQLNKILTELGIEKLNVFFYHDFNDFINYPSLMHELHVLKSNSKFDKIGLSVYDNYELEQAINNPSIDVIQMPFNLLDNMNERGALLTRAKTNNKIIQVRSIYLQGLFFKKIDELPDNLIPLEPYLSEINKIATKYKISVEELALGYALLQSQIDEIIIGVENKIQLIENIDLFKRSYDPTMVEEVNKINVNEKKLLYPKNWK